MFVPREEMFVAMVTSVLTDGVYLNVGVVRVVLWLTAVSEVYEAFFLLVFFSFLLSSRLSLLLKFLPSYFLNHIPAKKAVWFLYNFSRI